jgi:CheY-like chemotaxis protein
MTLRPGPSHLTVLVVEDNTDAADSYAMLLSMFGHTVLKALNGEAAIRAAAEHESDVALIDIILPDMDGYAVAKRLAQDEGHRPLLVAVTGCVTEEDVGRAYSAGFDLHLAKPVDPGALMKLLRRFERVVVSPTESVLTIEELVAEAGDGAARVT